MTELTWALQDSGSLEWQGGEDGDKLEAFAKLFPGVIEWPVLSPSDFADAILYWIQGFTVTVDGIDSLSAKDRKTVIGMLRQWQSEIDKLQRTIDACPRYEG